MRERFVVPQQQLIEQAMRPSLLPTTGKQARLGGTSAPQSKNPRKQGFGFGGCHPLRAEGGGKFRQVLAYRSVIQQRTIRKGRVRECHLCPHIAQRGDLVLVILQDARPIVGVIGTTHALVKIGIGERIAKLQELSADQFIVLRHDRLHVAGQAV
jgi:hypothetical protein